MNFSVLGKVRIALPLLDQWRILGSMLFAVPRITGFP